MAAKVQQSITINQPIERVFAFLTDPTNTPKWQLNVLESKVLTEGPTRVGTRIIEVRSFLGRKNELTSEITELEPNKRSYIRRLFQQKAHLSAHEAHEELINAAAVAVRDGAREGEWGPREVVAQSVGWEVEATERIPLPMAGSEALTYDDHAFNAVVLIVLGDQSFEMVRDMLRRTHQCLVQLLSAQEDAVFAVGNSIYERVKAQIHHSDKHAQQRDELL